MCINDDDDHTFGFPIEFSRDGDELGEKCLDNKHSGTHRVVPCVESHSCGNKEDCEEKEFMQLQ